MRLLAVENVPGKSEEARRARGYNIPWVRTDAPGSSDEDVVARATAERRILITFDRDFGELANYRGLPATSGIVLFRIPLSHLTASPKSPLPCWRLEAIRRAITPSCKKIEYA